MVYELPHAFQIPASGTIEYQKVMVPSGFTEDKWVQFAEARPDNRAQVHHMILFIREPGSHWLQRRRSRAYSSSRRRLRRQTADTSSLPSDFLVGYAPGQPPEMLPTGSGQVD